MAMTGSAMSSAVRAAIAGLTAEQKTDHTIMWDTICEAIVTYIQTNAVVAVTVESVSGVTTGIGVSGPGVGTGAVS